MASATQEQLDSQFWFDRTIEKFTTTLRIVPRARSCSAAGGSKVEMQVYPGAYHGFDRANSPVREFPEYRRTSVGVVPIQGTDPAGRRGSAESLPFADDTFDKALAINSMQVWPDAAAGLRAIQRVMRPGGRIALGFTRYSGQLNQGLEQALIAAGFADAQVKDRATDFCALAVKQMET